MRSKLHGCSQFQGRPVFQSPVAGWTFQPDGYELETPKAAEVKLPVSGATSDGDGLATGEGLDDGKADGDGDGAADADGDGVATAPGPVPDERKGPTRASPIAPTTITAVAATATLAKVFMSWNLRGTRISTRRCRVVSMEPRAACSTRSGACRGASVA